MTGMVEPRTEAQILGAEPKTVTLGGRPYGLAPKRGRKYTRAIRRKLAGVLDDVSGIGEVVKTLADSKVNQLDPGAIGAIVPLLRRFLGPDFDDLLDIVYEYSPEIAADRERLEEEATDEEFVAALFVIIGFLFGPFAKTLGIVYQPKTTISPSGGGEPLTAGPTP